MNRADRWLGNKRVNAQRGNVEVRSMDTARLIAERPSTIVLQRKQIGANTTMFLAPQTVRIELVQSIRNATEARNLQLDISQQYCVLIGLRDHPTLPNLDIQRADTFYFQGLAYEVIEFFNTIPGRLLASCQVTP